jgi:hypothetical protein
MSGRLGIGVYLWRFGEDARLSLGPEFYKALFE